MGSAADLLRLMELQRDLARMETMREERDKLVRSMKGELRVRRLADLIGMAPAQVSRIQNGRSGRARVS